MDITVSKLAMNFNDAGREISVFKDLDLTVQSGSSVAVVGQSGVGKTTLLYLIAGLERPSSGKILVGDTEVTSQTLGSEELARFRGRNIGFIFQFHHLLPEFDAIENVAMPLFIQGFEKEEAVDKAVTLLKQVGLGARLNHRPGMLSGGEQQRVAIARALCSGAKVLLADEPTGNLDQKTGSEVSELLSSMQRETNATLVVVTHSPDVAKGLDRTVELTANGLIEM